MKMDTALPIVQKTLLEPAKKTVLFLGTRASGLSTESIFIKKIRISKMFKADGGENKRWTSGNAATKAGSLERHPSKWLRCRQFHSSHRESLLQQKLEQLKNLLGILVGLLPEVTEQKLGRKKTMQQSAFFSYCNRIGQQWQSHQVNSD